MRRKLPDLHDDVSMTDWQAQEVQVSDSIESWELERDSM